MNRQIWLLLVSFILITCAFASQKNYFIPTPTPDWIRKIQTNLIKKYNGDDSSRLLGALLTGNKRRVRHKTKRLFKLFGIYHLLTPSGLHLSCFLFPFYFFFKRSKNKYWRWLIIVLSTLPFFLSGFHSLKRMGAFHVLKNVFPALSTGKTFLLTFLFDFMRGSFAESPISFSFSFLFMGIFCGRGNSIAPIGGSLFLGQLLLSSVLDQPFSPLGFIFGFFLTSIFSLIFPFVLLAQFFHSHLAYWPISLFYDLVELSGDLLSSTPAFYFIPESFFLLLVFALPKSRNKIIWLLISGLLCPGLLK